MAEDTELETDQVSIVVADIENYTEMNPAEQREFFNSIFPDISDIIKSNNFIESNSWGDGIIAFFQAPNSAADCAFELREYFREKKWSNDLLPTLEIRIAIHNAPVWRGYNPIRETTGVVGRGVNLAARVEPVVVPNHIFATESFKSSFEQQYGDDHIEFDKMEERELAKGWGKEQLYHMRKRTDQILQVDERISQIDDEEYSSEVDTLISFLEESRPEQKAEAVILLCEMKDPEAIEPLTQTLLNQENLAEVRQLIAERFREFDDERVINSLIEVAKDDVDDGVRRKAIFSIGKIGYATGLDTLSEILLDKSEPDAVRGAAAEALSNLEDGRALDPLISVLQGDEDISARLRKPLVMSMDDFDDERVIEPLISVLDDDNKEVRMGGIGVLGGMEDVRAVDPLCEILTTPNDYDTETRALAARSLKDIGDSSALDALASGVEQGDQDVVHECVKAIGKIGSSNPEKSVEILEDIATSSNEPIKIRAQAADSIGNIGSYSAISSLESIIENEDMYPATVRIGAVNGLEQISLPEISKPLIKAVDDPSYKVQENAASSLSEVDNPNVIKKIEEILKEPEDYQGDLRIIAINSLRDNASMAMGSPETLIEAMDDPREGVQIAAIRCLAELPSQKGFDKLVDIISDETYPAAVRGTAAQWIGEYDRFRDTRELIDYVNADKSTRVTANLIANFGLNGVTGAKEKITEIVLDEQSHSLLRRIGTLSITLLGGKEAEDVISEVVTDSNIDVQVRTAAARSLRALNTDSANEKLQNIANSDDLPAEIKTESQTALGRESSDERDLIKQALKRFLSVEEDNGDMDDEDTSLTLFSSD